MLQPTSEDAPPAAAPLAVTQPTPVPTSQRARRGSQATSVRSGFDLCFFTDPPTEERDCSLRAPSAAAIEEAATVVGSSSASWVATSSSGPAGEKPPAGIAGDKEGQGEDEVIYVVFEEGDPRDPFHFSHRRKWAISWVACLFTLLVSWALSSYSIAIADMRADMGWSRLSAAAGISVCVASQQTISSAYCYAWAFGLGPMVLAPIAEEAGRNVMYLVSAAIFAIFIIPCALAQNLETMLVARFIMGIAGSTGSTMVGGTMADIWRSDERGLPMSIFAAAALMGIALGAICMGYVAESAGWRVVQWIFFGLVTALLPVMFFTLKETRASVILTRIAKKKRAETGDERYRSHAELERPPMIELVKLSLTRPFWFLVSEPVVTAFSLWIGFAWGVLYGVLQALPFVLERLHNFSTGQIGLSYFTFFIAVCLGFVANLYQDKLYLRYQPTMGPEARLFGASVAAVLFPIGCLCFAWTSYSHVHWIAPCISMTVTVFAIFQIYLSVFNYLSDCYLIYASSALAAQSFSRNFFAGIFPLIITAMYEGLNPRWAATLCGLVGAVLGIVPFVLIKYGPRIRAASKVAQTLLQD